MKALRAAVSGSRVRYMQDGYDLDLTYITPRLIAMGYPAAGVEKTYRNNISEVASFLNSHHPESYRVFNLSERKYDYAKFDGRVTECGFPDHHPPPLQVLLDIMNDMLEWTARSSKHVVVVHCLAGKGRTGVVCSCYLLLVGFYGSIYKLRKEKEIREVANRAIRDFWNARGQGVRFPSQALYIYYFIKVLRRLGRTPTRIPPLLPAKRLLLRRVVLQGIPDFDAPPRGGIVPFLQVLPAPSQHEKADLLYNSSWQQPKFEVYAPDPNGCIIFDTNCVIQGDILIRAFHASSSAIMGKHFSQIFHFTFNTDFLRKESNFLRLHRDELDDVGSSSHFPSTFRVDCEMEPLDEQEASAPTAPPVVRNNNNTNSSSMRLANAAATGRFSQSDGSTSWGLQSSAAPTQSAGDAAPVTGWLYKQGGFVKNWKKRWFVAREGKLMYFHGASDPTPLGTVDLRGVTVAVSDAAELNARNQCLHYFKVVPRQKDQRTYFFGADSEQEMIRWIRALGKLSAYGLSNSSTSAGMGSSRGARGEFHSSSAANERRNSRGNEGHVRHSDSRVAYTSDQVPIGLLSIRSPPGDELSSRFSGAAATRSMRSHNANATELTYSLRQSEGFSNQSQQQQHRERPSSSRGSFNVSLTETDDDDLQPYLTSTNAPEYVPSKPLSFEPMFSENERATILQEVNFGGGIYVYSADELSEIARLQQYLRATPTRDNTSTLYVHLQRLIAQQRLVEAEEMLVDVVIKFFAQLVDAMDYDPIAFTQMVVDASTMPHNAAAGQSGGVFF